MIALRHAEATGHGQVVDLSIYEPLFWILGAQTSAYDQLGTLPTRQGSRTGFNVPRECYRTRDGRWIALSGATTATAQRIMRAVGRPDLADAEWFSDISGRIEHRETIDEAIASWVGQRDNADVLAMFESVGATAGPVYTAADIVADPHFTERGSIVTVDHPTLGAVRMQGLIAQLSRTPGQIRHPGPAVGEHNDEILRTELAYPDDVVDALAEAGVIGRTLQPTSTKRVSS